MFGGKAYMQALPRFQSHLPLCRWKEIEPRSEVAGLTWRFRADFIRAFGSLAEKVTDYEALLRDLTLRVSDEDANVIKTLLAKVWWTGTLFYLCPLIHHQDVAPGSGDSPGIASASQEPDGVSEEAGEESDASAGVGSTGAVDRIEEDFNRSEEARNTGFMGKNSEITWLQRLRQENQFGSPDGPGSEAEFKAKTGGASPSLKVARLRAENTKPCLTPLKGSL